MVSGGAETGLAMMAWLVAVALALAAGGGLAGWSFYRRALQAERRLRALEAAVAEFCGALRARLLAERGKLAVSGGDVARHEQEPTYAGEGALSERAR